MTAKKVEKKEEKKNMAVSITVKIAEFGNEPKVTRQKIWDVLEDADYTQPEGTKSGMKTELRKGIGSASLEKQKEIQKILDKKE